MSYGLLKIKKSKQNFKLILVLVLASYLIIFGCINWISSIIELYHGFGEETRYTDASLQTRIILTNHPLKMKKKDFMSKSKPQPNSTVGCSSLIEGVGVEKK